MTAAKMLQRSPGKALSMTSPLARQMARVRETGSLDVPEKTRFLSPIAVLDRRQEGARNGFRNHISSREHSSIFFLDTLWKSPVAVSQAEAHSKLRRDPYPASNTEVLPVLDFRSHPSEGNTMWFERARFTNPQCRRLLLCSLITPLLAVPVAAQDNAEPVAGAAVKATQEASQPATPAPRPATDAGKQKTS